MKNLLLLLFAGVLFTSCYVGDRCFEEEHDVYRYGVYSHTEVYTVCDGIYYTADGTEITSEEIESLSN